MIAALSMTIPLTYKRRAEPKNDFGWICLVQTYDCFELFLFCRRESGMCRICWSADAVDDVGVTGKTVGVGVVLVRINVVVKIRP